MNEVLKKIQKIGIVPVVVLDNAEDALPLAQALIQGGLPCAEVTFRTAAAEESIRQMTEKFPEMLVGAGTVLNIENVEKAVAAGAKFIVSPGLNPEVVKYCVDHEIPITPGTANPTDIEAAMSFGLDVVKFFPAEPSGGLAMIKAMSAPYGTMKFMPTGGIGAKNIVEYLNNDKIIACGGSWMVKEQLIREGDFEKITQLTREAVMTVLGFELAQMDICGQNEKQVNQIGALFGGLFETNQASGLGENGKITVKANSVDRAMNYLESQGIEFVQDSGKYDGGKLKEICLKEQIGGFVVRLLQK